MAVHWGFDAHYITVGKNGWMKNWEKIVSFQIVGENM